MQWLMGIFAWLLLHSLASFVMMAWDKRQAARDGQRVPESVLHVLELLGGWPGSLLASAWLRHKSKKLSYRVVRWGCVVLNGIVLAAVCYLMGRLSG